jgi:hypothetical protein
MSFRTAVTSITDPIREFVTLRRAESTVRAYLPAQHLRVRAHAAAAEARLHAGRKVSHPVAAAVLLREAVVHYLAALEAARDPDAEEQALATRTLEMPELPPDPARPRAEPSDDARVRAALAARDPLYFDSLPTEDVERTRWALDRAGGMLRRRVEARSLASVRGTRWGRIAALVVVALYAALAFVKAKLLPQNVALHKPVHASSMMKNPPDGHELVDGEVGPGLGIHTNTEDSPSVTIDLTAEYWVQRVKVHNRVDGYFDDCLPLVVEVSRDDKVYQQVARRDVHFDAEPPWVVDAGGRPARYVRIRVDRRSYLALSEVEVYGKKL